MKLDEKTIMEEKGHLFFFSIFSFLFLTVVEHIYKCLVGMCFTIKKLLRQMYQIYYNIT